MNLLPGDGVTLAAKYVRQIGSDHHIFEGARSGRAMIAGGADIVDIQLPPLAIGDQVVTLEGEYGTVIGLLDSKEIAWINLGVNGWGIAITTFCHVETLTRGASVPQKLLTYQPQR